MIRASVKLFVWLLAGIGLLLVVLVALLFFVDVSLYRTQIEQQVSTAFDRQVVLEGPLSLEPSLTPRLAVKGLKIANPDWASRPFLATVDKFDIRVSLLPLLRGRLEIIALEFHGVDVLLEKTSSGANNFTFGESSEPTALPTIEHMSLYDLTIAYAAPQTPLRRLHLEQITALKVPNQLVELEAHTAVNAVPVTISLRGEPRDAGHPKGPWQIILSGKAGDLSLRAEGSVTGPIDWSQGEHRLNLKGRHLNELEALSGFTLPKVGPYALNATVRFNLDEYLMVNDLAAHIGASDLQGNLHWDMGNARSAIKVRLESQQLHVGDMGFGDPLTRNTDQADTEVWSQPLDLGVFDTVDLDVEVKVKQLDGLAKPTQDIVLTTHTDHERLELAVVHATVDETQIAVSAVLPWGERLTTVAPEGFSLKTLLQQAELDIQAQAPDLAHRYETTLLGHPLDFWVSTLKATARPGAALTIRAEAVLNDGPVSLNLQGGPLAVLAQRPTGPWQDLVVEVQTGDTRFQATGSVERPFEAMGFDIHYALHGAEIDTLLPLFDLVLPLAGPYSLTGHFADLTDRHVFDELKITSGSSDISGQISVYQGKHRPRVEANLFSEQIYLSEFLPVSDMQEVPDEEHRVIPDYELPIEHMRQIDGELQFKGKRLRTAAGNLGDIEFRATLKDAVFKLDSFRVRGWAGALIESDAMIDASQNPPAIALQWIARQLNYGVLLDQAGFAETVEGHLDITLRLSGGGGTREEILGDANGQLIIVGREGKFGSRRLDLWGSDLVTTMLSRQWRREDVTDINCIVARINIEDGIAKSDSMLIDSRRITIGAAGTLDLNSEELNLVIAPRPKRASLVSLTNPVHVTGTLAKPEVTVAVLPRNRIAAAGGLLAGLVNPVYLVFTLAQLGSGEANPCLAAVEKAMEMKGMRDQTDDFPTASP